MAGGQPAAGLRDDLYAAFNQPALAPVGFEGVQFDAHHIGLDELDRFDDVG
jgi:hypothetical protein